MFHYVIVLIKLKADADLIIRWEFATKHTVKIKELRHKNVIAINVRYILSSV